MKKIALVTTIVILFANIAFCQAAGAGYKGGNDSLMRKIVRSILKSKNPTIWTDSNIYVLAFIEINRDGKIQNLTLTSFKDTVFTKSVFNTIIQTEGHWYNNTNASQFFEIPFLFLYSSDGDKEVIDRIPTMDISHYVNGSLTNYVKLRPVRVICYPSQR
jgi:hypothetical protein